MSASNVDPNIAGSTLIGSYSTSTIPLGQPPTVPQTMTNTDFSTISNIVLGRIGMPDSSFNTETSTQEEEVEESIVENNQTDSGEDTNIVPVTIKATPNNFNTSIVQECQTTCGITDG